MPGKRKGIVRHKDIFVNTFELEENKARQYMKTLFGAKRLTWAEQGMGSTNGGPDCWMTRGNEWGYLPIEVKKSYRYMKDEKGIPRFVQIRHVTPGQIEWHTKQHERFGMTTIILVLLSEGMSGADDSFWAVVEGYNIVDWFEGMKILRVCFGKDLAEILGVQPEY